MLKLAHLQRSLWLRDQIRRARASKPKARLLHLLPTGCSSPQKSIRETAYLMQLRLHLEALSNAKTDSVPPDTDPRT